MPLFQNQAGGYCGLSSPDFLLCAKVCQLLFSAKKKRIALWRDATLTLSTFIFTEFPGNFVEFGSSLQLFQGLLFVAVLFAQDVAYVDSGCGLELGGSHDYRTMEDCSYKVSGRWFDVRWAVMRS
jgi:hypothetical protein